MPALSPLIVFCGNENRRERVRVTLGPGGVPALNGIDFLEIANDAQTELTVHFIHPLPGQADGVPGAGAPVLNPDNVRIAGGERLRDIVVTNVVAAGNLLTVTVASPGDFSSYELRLVAGPGLEAPPAGFDPPLSRVRFSFKANCPSPFDCRAGPGCAEEAAASPRIDYLARDYTTFRRVLLDRLRLLMPTWKEDSAADFPIVVTELLAYVGDQLAYAQDSAATESYPGTALHRISLRRHARLRDYRMHEGCNARTWVQMNVEPGGAADGRTLPVGTQFFAGTSEQRGLAQAGRLDELSPDKSAIFESMEAVTVHAAHNRFEVYTWSDNECVLCAGATSATLRRPPGASLAPRDVLIFEELRDPLAAAGAMLAGRTDRRWPVRLSTVEEIVDPLDGTTLYAVGWHADDALPFSFVLSRRTDGELVENISIARGNVVLADHGLTAADSDADPSLTPRRAPVDGTPFQPVLAEAGLTFRTMPPATPGTSARRSVLQSPTTARPQVWLDSAGERWNASLDLLASDGDAAEFVVEVDNDRRAHLRFGDGEHGRAPAVGQDFSAVFRFGNGTRGNIGAEAISAILVPGGGFSRVRNPLPAVGGTDPEALEEVRQLVPAAFRTQQRAVTLADYEERAREFPGCQQARAEFRWLASWYTVVVAVDRAGGVPVDESFRADLLAHLEPYRMAGYDLEVRDPVFVPLEIELQICLRPGASRSRVFQELSERLGSGPRGLFHPDRLTFGQRLFSSEIVAQAAAVAGVDHVQLTTLKRFREPAGTELQDGVLEVSGLELPQLANNPSFPERGLITFMLEGGT